MSFTIERNLPPTLVTRDLIEMIERVIKEFIVANVGDDENLKNELIGRISVCIRDDQGEEEIRSISEMHLKKFHDSTKSVYVSFSGLWGVPLGRYEISVRFFVRPSISEIRVSCAGNNARAMAVGVADSLVRIAQASPNNNGFFHASPLKTGLTYFLFSMIFLLARINDTVGDGLYFGALGLILVAQVGQFIFWSSCFHVLHFRLKCKLKAKRVEGVAD